MWMNDEDDEDDEENGKVNVGKCGSFLSPFFCIGPFEAKNELFQML